MCEKSKIYTRSGDKGMTSLVGGYRVRKTHPRLEAYGTIDELNSFIGLLITELEEEATRELILFIQSKLFSAGSYLATDPSKTEMKAESHITDECIQKMEEAIDRTDSGLPKLKAFVLPGGTRTAATAHVCRTVCRRAERAIFHLTETETVEDNVLIFINRLSDLLFVIARSECMKKKGEEIFWNNPCR
jgi:cob(I)alamin adenosyltransferase